MWKKYTETAEAFRKLTLWHCIFKVGYFLSVDVYFLSRKKLISHLLWIFSSQFAFYPSLSWRKVQEAIANRDTRSKTEVLHLYCPNSNKILFQLFLLVEEKVSPFILLFLKDVERNLSFFKKRKRILVGRRGGLKSKASW